MAFTKIAAAGIGSTGTVTLENLVVTRSLSASSGVSTFSTLTVGTGGTIITTTSGGLVGIGTTNPSSVLNIVGGSIPVKINNTASDGLQIIRQSKTLGLNANYDNANTHCLITASSGMDLAFATNGDIEKIRITGIGSVGIGLTNPNARLTIKSFGANTTPLNIQNSGNTSIFKISQSTGGSGILELRDSTDKTYMIADTSSGFVGVGTANPDSIFQVGSGPDAIVNGFSNSRLVVSDSGNTQADVFVRCHSTDVMARMTVVSTNAIFGSVSNHPVEFYVNNTNQLSIDTSGNLLPAGDANRNLGSPAARWANIYSADLQLSNEGSQNDVDGTWGKYTIQEGENDLFLINRRTGKKYKFLLEEVQ